MSLEALGTIHRKLTREALDQWALVKAMAAVVD
jgi:hypothetical protein